ncbi:MAG: hypothetical protein FJZ15_07100 [Candidatus Omnitrophica bacterium]|nr:hypothetical protein [Candidatus Omnitrophota bacterium]
MKKHKFILSSAIVFFCVFSVWFGARIVGLSLIKERLSDLFPQSIITIEKCNFAPLGRLTFKNIKIKKSPVYEITVKEAGAAYSLPSLFKFNIPLAYLHDVHIYLNSSKKIIPELIKYARIRSPGVFSLGAIELKDIKVQAKSVDLAASGNFSATFNLLDDSLDHCCINAESLRINNIQSKNLYFCAKQKKPGGIFSVKELMLDKARLKNVQSSVNLNGRKLSLVNLSGEIFRGVVNAELNLNTSQWDKFDGNLKFKGLDLEDFVGGFELEKKFMMSGKIGGSLELEGAGAKLNIISGKFDTEAPGGTLVITDTAFLEKLSERTGQSFNILVEGFRNYHYNVGSINLSIDKGDLICDTRLDGKNGKRNLTIVLHDFSLERGRSDD